MIRRFSETEFLKSRYNWYDMYLLVIMLVTMVIHQAKPHLDTTHGTHSDRYLALALIMMRYCSQLFRLVMIVVNAMEVGKIRNLQEISFGGLTHKDELIEDVSITGFKDKDQSLVI